MESHLRLLVELIRRHGLDRYTEVRRTLKAIELGLFDEGFARAYLHKIQPLIDEQERRPNFLHRAPDIHELYPNGIPPLSTGSLEENPDVPIAMSLDGPFHSIIAGTTGSGKTITMRRLITAIEERRQSHNTNLAVIALDIKGNDYADLPSLFGGHWRHFDAHGDLRLGLQNPVGVPANIWINHMATSFCARAGLVSAWVTFANMMRWLVAAMNPQPSDQLLFPDFQLLLDLANNLPKTAFSQKPQYLESLTQYLEGITQASGALFRTFNGLDLERDLISKGLSAVISMPNLSPPWLNQFIADQFIHQLLLGRIHRNCRVDSTEVILVIDEADNYVSRDNERLFPTSMPPIVQGLRQLREFGVGVFLGIGALGPVSEHVLNSAAYQFVFRMNNDDCVNVARRTLQLPPHSQSIIAALEPGECLFRRPGPWPHAMLGRIDGVSPCRAPQQTFDANDHIAAKRLCDMPAVRESVEKLTAEHNRTARRRKLQKHAGLRPEARKLLYLASMHPGWPVVRLYDLMEKPTPMIQKSIRQEVQREGFAKLKDVRVGRKPLCLIELTDTSWRLLGESPNKLSGRGGLAHRTFANWIHMVGVKRGYESVLEWKVPVTTHPVDVAWKVDGRWQVFEVVVTSDLNLESSLDAALLSSASVVEKATIVAPQKATLERLRKQFASFANFDSFKDRVDFIPVETFEKELWP